MNDPKIGKVFKDPEFKSRGALYLLKEIWNLKADVTSIERVMELNKDFFDKEDDLVLSIGQYLLKGVSGMSEGLWEEAYRMGVAKGYFPEGGNYMGIREYIKEEGLQEGRQSVALKMLQEGVDIAFVSKVTGLSKEEIEKLTNGKNNVEGGD